MQRLNFIELKKVARPAMLETGSAFLRTYQMMYHSTSSQQSDRVFYFYRKMQIGHRSKCMIL